MTWFTGIPSLDCHDPLDSQELAARFTAFACATRLHPIDARATRFADTPAHKAAGVFLPWLRDAKEDRDAYLRRLALAFACEQPREDTDDKQVLKIAQSTHRWLALALTRRPRPG